MSKAAEAVRHILATASSEEDEPSAGELIEEIIDEHGWPLILEEMLALLRTYVRTEDWHTAAEVIWGAALDRRELVADEVIAHLYYRLPEDTSSDLGDCENLAWSITTKLKGVNYLSEYDPLEDEGVRRVLERLAG